MSTNHYPLASTELLLPGDSDADNSDATVNTYWDWTNKQVADEKQDAAIGKGGYA